MSEFNTLLRCIAKTNENNPVTFIHKGGFEGKYILQAFIETKQPLPNIIDIEKLGCPKATTILADYYSVPGAKRVYRCRIHARNKGTADHCPYIECAMILYWINKKYGNMNEIPIPEYPQLSDRQGWGWVDDFSDDEENYHFTI